MLFQLTATGLFPEFALNMNIIIARQSTVSQQVPFLYPFF